MNYEQLENVMVFNTALFLILCILMTGYGIFLIALSIRLWRVLGYIERACASFLVTGKNFEVRKDHAIAMYKEGKSIGSIARKVGATPDEVKLWVVNHQKDKVDVPQDEQ